MDGIDGPRSIVFGFRMARIGAKRATGKIKMGAALVDHGLVVVSSNMIRTSPHVKRVHGYRFENSSHCEWRLFSYTGSVPKKVTGTVFVYREFANGELAEARPCLYCRNYLSRLGIKRVYYTTNNSYKEERI